MLLQDLPYARRVLMAQKSFTVVAALTLALGIGANTAIFSIVYGVLFTTGLVAMFAALAIASIGVYGVIAYSVSRRTREIGVRVTPGAERSGVVWLVTRETLALVGAGMLGGFAAAAAMAYAIRGMLFQVSPADPLTYAGVVAVLGGVALAATCVPARRALAVDPMTALRCE